MIWIGLTGGIGSGKSQAAGYFRLLGVPIIDADEVNRELVNHADGQAMALIKNEFGVEYLNDSGGLNRAAMRELIFSQPSAKVALEKILHPLILQRIIALQNAADHNNIYGLVELPILRAHSMFLQIIQRILLIDCAEAIRIQRVVKRNHFSEQQVKNMIAHQPSDVERLALANDVIDNSGSLHDLKRAVESQHMIYQEILNTRESC